MKNVLFIEHGKEKIPYRVKYYALKEWQKETGKTLADLDSLDSDLSLLEPLFFHSVMSGYKDAGQKCPYKREELSNILDDCWLAFMKGVPSFFQ
jgi:hypothetical protein